MTTVVREWVSSLTWKEQSVLFSAIRSADSGSCPEIKRMTHWIRSVILEDADPSSSFMKEKDTEHFNIPRRCTGEQTIPIFDMVTIHFYGHLMQAFEIIGYCHPDILVREKAQKAYQDMVTYLHLHIETKAQMEQRLRDQRKDEQ